MNQTLARRAIAVAGTSVVLLVLGIAVSILIARALGPAGRGQYAFTVAVATTVVALAHMSVEYAQAYLFSTGTALARLASNALLLGTVLGLVGIVGVLGLCAIFDYPAEQPWADTALLLALAAVPLSITVIYCNGLLMLEGRTDLLNRGNLLAGVVQCVALGALAVTGRLTPTIVVSVWLLNAALPLFVSLTHLRPRISDTSWPLVRQELATGARYHPGLASAYLLLRVDVLILAALSDDRAVGLYALAVSLIELTNVATDAMASVIIRRQMTASIADAAVLTARVVGLTVVFASVAVVGLVTASPILVPLLYGGEFREAVPALFCLAPGVLALATTRSAGRYLVRLDRPWTLSALTTVAMVVNVALNFVLIPPFGIVGASLASSSAYMFLALIYLVWFLRVTKLDRAAFRPHLASLRHSSAS